MRLLDGLRPAPHRAEVDHLAVILGLFLRPDRLDRLHALAQKLPSSLEHRAVVGHLLTVPSAADPEQKPTVGDGVEARSLLGGVDWIALDQQADAGPDLERLRGDSRGRQGHKGIHRVHVHPRQLAARRVRGGAAGGDVRVLGDPEGLEPRLLDGRRQLGHGDRVVGGKDRDTELHRANRDKREEAGVGRPLMVRLLWSRISSGTPWATLTASCRRRRYLATPPAT